MNLEKLYEIYNSIVFEFLKNPRQYDEYGKRVSIDTEMYKALIAYSGFDGKPQILSGCEYDNIDAPEIFHGFTDKNHGLELLISDKYNLGTGGYTPGLFFTKDNKIATWYTNHEVEGLVEDEERVLSVKVASNNGMKFSNLQDLIVSPLGDLPPDTKPEHKDKIRELYKFCDMLQSQGKNPQGFLKTMKKSSNFSVYLGLDYLLEQKYGHVILHNRKVLVASQKSLEKFGEYTSKK